MNTIKVNNGPFNKSLNVPFSKSYLNRLLILASLKPGPVTIQGFSPSQDVLDLIQALKKVGLKITVQDQNVLVENSFPECETISATPIDLDVGEGGTTARFLMSFLARGKQIYRLKAQGRLNARPFLPLIEVLKNLEVKFTQEEKNAVFPLLIQGSMLIPEKLTIDARESSQFVSSLMLSLADQTIEYTYKAEQSSAYIELTKKLVTNFKQNIFEAKADFSSAAYPVCLALLHGEVLIENIFEADELQADSFLLKLLSDLKLSYEFSQKGLKVFKQDLYSGFHLDIREYLDLVPALCFLASYAQTSSSFKHVRYLRSKESDRLGQIQEILTAFGIVHHYDEPADELIIRGLGKKCETQKIITAPDHRMVMTAYLFLRHNSGGELAHTECVKKSFPHFFELMQ